MDEIIKKIKEYRRLTYEEQIKMFEAPNAVELLEQYSQKWDWLCDAAEVKMLEHPERVRLLGLYSRSRSLSLTGELAMLKSADCVDLFRVYLANDQFLFEKSERKMLELPQRGKLLLLYMAKFPLWEETVLKMLDLPERQILLRVYLQHGYRLLKRAERKARKLGLI